MAQHIHVLTPITDWISADYAAISERANQPDDWKIWAQGQIGGRFDNHTALILTSSPHCYVNPNGRGDLDGLCRLSPSGWSHWVEGLEPGNRDIWSIRGQARKRLRQDQNKRHSQPILQETGSWSIGISGCRRTTRDLSRTNSSKPHLGKNQS